MKISSRNKSQVTLSLIDRPNIKQNFLKPLELSNHKEQFQEYLVKLESVTKSCDVFKKQINLASKIASKRFKKQMRTFDNVLHQDEDNTWRKNLMDFHESQKKNDLYLKIRSFAGVDEVDKRPIQRQKGNYKLSVPKINQISVSDLTSSQGKLILSKIKRPFGEIQPSGVVKHVGERYLEVIQNFEIEKELKLKKKDMQLYIMKHKVLSSSKKLPKLAKKIKNKKLLI